MNSTEQITAIEQVIKLRRTVKPDRMNGRRIDDEDIHSLLALADWAPTHARTEPWRFIVFGGDQVKTFATRHADLYRANTDPANFTLQKYDNIQKQGDLVSHVIIAWMKRVPSHKIPEIEEIASASAAIQNILLGAAAREIATFWSTGGMALHPAFHDEFKLGEEDKVLGILYLGYADGALMKGTRLTPLSEKIEWVK